MKRIISVFCVFCVLLTALSLQVFAADGSTTNQSDVTKEYTEAFLKILYKGDVNDDGSVSIEDASEYLRVAANLQEPRENVNYDINGDGLVTTADARLALRVASGLETTATEEDIFDYFSNELNTVKSSRPGFSRTLTSTCTAAKINVTGAPKGLTWDLNANDMDYVQYLTKNEKVFVAASSQEEFNAMLAEAKSVYTPMVNKRVVNSGSSQHYTYFPVQGLGTTCRLSYEDVKDVTLKITDGYFIITMTLNDYTYEGDNPYPAKASEFTARQNIPYGKIFSLPEFNDDTKFRLEKVVLDKGKVTVKIDSATGKIINADFFYRYTTVMEVVSEDAEAEGMVTKMKNVIEHDEYFEMKG